MMYWLYRGLILRLAKPSINSISKTPHLLQKSDKPFQESSHLQFFMSNNTFTPRISCILNQFVGFFSENRTPKSLSFDSEFSLLEMRENRVLWVQKGRPRHCHVTLPKWHCREARSHGFGSFLCVFFRCDYDILSLSHGNVARVHFQVELKTVKL